MAEVPPTLVDGGVGFWSRGRRQPAGRAGHCGALAAPATQALDLCERYAARQVVGAPER